MSRIDRLWGGGAKIVIYQAFPCIIGGESII